MRIGILLTGHVADLLVDGFGDYPSMFRTLLDGYGFEFRTWAVVDMEFPESVHDADGWLLTGSRFGAYEDHPFIPPLEQFIRDAHAAGVPQVGVCFGHQIIAQAMGGKVEKFPAGWSVGAKDYRFGDETLTLNAWHQDQVTQVPPGARVIASSDFCANAALVYGDRIYSVQPHPEIRNDYLQGLIETRGRGTVPDPVLDHAVARIGVPIHERDMADRMAEFFKTAHAKCHAGAATANV